MIKSRRFGHLWLFDLAADLAAIVVSYRLGILLRFRSGVGETIFTAINQFLGVSETVYMGKDLEIFYYLSTPRLVFILATTLCLLYALANLYPGRRFIRRRPIAGNVIMVNLVALGIFYMYFYLTRNTYHPRSLFVTVLFLNAILCILFRALVQRGLGRLRGRFGWDCCRTLLIGDSEEACFIERLVSDTAPHGIRIVERQVFDPKKPFGDQVRSLEEAARRERFDMIVSADKSLSVQRIMQLVELAERLQVPVKILSHELDVLFSRAKLPVDLIHGVPLVHFNGPTREGWDGVVPRALSAGLAGVLTLLTLPLMAAIALLVRLTSPGPALFIQERIGVNRKPFMMYKFRTMYHRADELQAQVEEFNESGKGLFKIRRDPRVTPVGRFLRRFSLDELPQLINVMRGKMSFVGPRPLPRRDFENYYEEWHYTRHSGMPGLTCLWQVSGRSEIDFHNMCILDVYYLSNQSWVLDVKILLRTLWVVMFAKGAY